MRTRWPPRWPFITKSIRKSSLRPTKSRDLHAKCLFYWLLNYIHHPCDPSDQCYHSAFDIFKMASKIVANKFFNPWERHPTCTRCLYKHTYLNKQTWYACIIELHCKCRHIWEWHQGPKLQCFLKVKKDLSID